MRLIRRRKGEIVSHGGVDMRIVATPEFDTLTLQGPDGEYPQRFPGGPPS